LLLFILLLLLALLIVLLVLLLFIFVLLLLLFFLLLFLLCLFSFALALLQLFLHELKIVLGVLVIMIKPESFFVIFYGFLKFSLLVEGIAAVIERLFLQPCIFGRCGNIEIPLHCLVVVFCFIVGGGYIVF